jgi:hypothetical protein
MGGGGLLRSHMTQEADLMKHMEEHVEVNCRVSAAYHDSLGRDRIGVTLAMTYEPDGTLENIGEALGVVRRQRITDVLQRACKTTRAYGYRRSSALICVKGCTRRLGYTPIAYEQKRQCRATMT